MPQQRRAACVVKPPAPTTADDPVIATLADSEAALVDRIVDLELEVRVWREIAQQAIHLLRERETEINRRHAQDQLLRTEHRPLRAEHRQGGA